MPHHLSFFFALCLATVVFLTNHQQATAWSGGSHCLAPPTRSADRVRVWGSKVQEVRSGNSVSLCMEGRSWDVGAGARGRCEGHKGENESLEMVSRWADPEPSSCQPEVFALPLTSPLFIFKSAAAAPLCLKRLVSFWWGYAFRSLISTTGQNELAS